jgi:hypothetical protein
MAAIAPINKAKSKHKKLCSEFAELRSAGFELSALTGFLIRVLGEFD